MPLIKGEFIIIVKIITSCLTAAFLIFFISALSGEDLKKNNDIIGKLNASMEEISTQLDTGIQERIGKLGEVPSINPYKKFYCVEFAKEIHDISYLTEKQKILFDTYNVRDFETKSKRLVSFTENSDIDNLLNELEIVKRELKNSVNLISKKKKRLTRQRNAYIIFFFILWVVLYIYYSRGLISEKDKT
ncbi:MAG: hypothetical protein KJO26_16435 [Deltaproteobacteria bacterium]|nr:hypothetical protein [Deltaproteobacteria bacterium]MBT8356337.1 hypothetical protein [Deltaproteobacteria bacterium]MBT8374446.1 hypothetical protein [Deltaproteobacteria bacterium]NNK85629.1 hypothetical protein [Desulfobacterales bacterium]